MKEILERLGVQTVDNTGAHRSVSEIFDEMAKKWKSLDEHEKDWFFKKLSGEKHCSCSDCTCNKN